MSKIEEINNIEPEFQGTMKSSPKIFNVTKIDYINNFAVLEGDVNGKPFKASIWDNDIGFNEIKLGTNINDYFDCIAQSGNYWNFKRYKDRENYLTAEEYFNLK